eukprot:4613799-Alexandrium_andersonii.AAC.1
MASSMGFPTWASKSDLCVLCHCKPESWCGLSGFSPASMPEPPNTYAQHKEACAQYEIRIALDEPSLARA